MIFTREKIEELLVHCRLSDAAAFLTVSRSDSSHMERERRAARAGTYAIAGDDRGLARVIAPELLTFRNVDAAAGIDDQLAAGVALAWAGDAAGTYDALNRAHDLALGQERFYLAVAARERLSHHALLFGDVTRSQAAIEDAIALARRHRLPALADAMSRARRAAVARCRRPRPQRADSRSGARRAEHAGNARALFAPAGARWR